MSKCTGAPVKVTDECTLIHMVSAGIWYCDLEELSVHKCSFGSITICVTCMCTTWYLQCSGNGLEGLGAGKWPLVLTGYFLSTPQMLSALHTEKKLWKTGKSREVLVII